jgi:hypothetical protein
MHREVKIRNNTPTEDLSSITEQALFLLYLTVASKA